MKDNFSAQAALYARFRPAYPPELIAHLASLAPNRQSAWDCGTGNGQVAAMLAGHFGQVYATDISEKQLGEAPAHPRIRYALEPAEQCSAPDQAFDLIVVAQAIHWFNFDRFYAQVRRVLRPGGVLAVLGYGIFRTDSPAVDALIHRFYTEITGPYWDPERRYLDEGYHTIPFPLEEIRMPDFAMQYRWTFPDVIGYLNTWSAVQHYIRENGENPVALMEAEFRRAWGGVGEREVRFPLLTRVGKV
jgi:SAM-dependent methyltransferase